ncbi:hypothetical protein CYV15_09605 [Riemerella anatipestifer]|uniref:hypothetical protein n=1 Tax=Riemerella anatipestifer TaxID=34085 RepID=UPI0007EC30BD|nr:hypothetical protein [Riemerella anatipestifer]MDY3505092.1 hypothetical protein [Riemerella anatipestifer]OBP39331.1 hypothetical protein AWR40_00715 [Riemerella anatipestifer]OBP61606.1 hypothetical protein AQB27_00710 [Riemerella anatipestifer]PST43515.1 hypothetical protein CYV15_09605 [Riemerella anatipestifer]
MITQKTQAFFEKPTETQKSLNVNVNENVNVNKNVNNNSSYDDNSVAKHRKTSQGDNSIANIADKDSVSDSDKDSDKENNSSYGED